MMRHARQPVEIFTQRREKASTVTVSDSSQILRGEHTSNHTTFVRGNEQGFYSPGTRKVIQLPGASAASPSEAGDTLTNRLNTGSSL